MSWGSSIFAEGIGENGQEGAVTFPAPRRYPCVRLLRAENLFEGSEERSGRAASKVDASIEPPVRLATESRDLPREEFKERLKSELSGGTSTMTTVAENVAVVHTTAAPRLTLKDAAKAIEFYQRA